jgi:2-polyprenyl-3-methyl-5-hydroxy-6-metoxy-1,4-benzoquinol methylase
VAAPESPASVNPHRLHPNTLGFRIEAFLDLEHWKPVAIDGSVPLVQFPACPSDGATLRTLCTLVGDGSDQRIRIGCCSDCGHVTYIDRPTQEWIDRYYLSVWDAHELDSRVDRRTRRLAASLPSPNTSVKIALGLEIDRSRPICEIGCGYGANLKHLANAGFTDLTGIEASQHRAGVVTSLFGFDAFAGAFESRAVQEQLRPRAPFSIIYSHHALEHTYHPDAVLAAASRLQQPGEYLIISVPRHELEPSMSVLLFLPHLHSFTRASLERLAARSGYALVDDSWTHPKNLNLVFRKTDRPVAPAGAEAPFERSVEKFVRGLELGRRYWLPQRLWWQTRSTDRAGHVWMTGPASFQARRWDRVMKQLGVENPRSARVSRLRRRVTTVVESPLEIQFAHGLMLLFK